MPLPHPTAPTDRDQPASSKMSCLDPVFLRGPFPARARPAPEGPGHQHSSSACWNCACHISWIYLHLGGPLPCALSRLREQIIAPQNIWPQGALENWHQSSPSPKKNTGVIPKASPLPRGRTWPFSVCGPKPGALQHAILPPKTSEERDIIFTPVTEGDTAAQHWESCPKWVPTGSQQGAYVLCNFLSVADPATQIECKDFIWEATQEE